MPSTPTYGLPYPAITDPPNGATQIQALAAGVEEQLTALAENFAGQLAALTDALDAATTPGPWQNLTLAPGLVANDSPPQARLMGGIVVLRGGVGGNGANLTGGTLATLPSGLRPDPGLHVAISCSTAGARTQAATRVWIAPDGTIGTIGDQDANFPPWVSFSGVAFSLT